MAIDCLNDDGYTEGERIRSDAVQHAANVRRLAALAIAVDNAAQLISNYKKQRDIADRGMKIAEEQQRHMQEVYWPRELQFLEEFGNPEDIESAYVLGRRYGGRLVAGVAAEFAKKLKEADCMAPRYCTSARGKTIQDLLLARAESIANARVLGRLIGFSEVQARTNLNDERRLQAIAIGKDLMGQSASLYASAGQGLAGAGKEISARLNNALEMFGYASRDPGRGNLDSLLNQARQEQFDMQARAPFNAVQSPGSKFAVSGSLSSNVSEFASQDLSRAVDLNNSTAYTLANNYPLNSSRSLQNEQWNDAHVGNRDLARSGSMTYDFTDSRGDRGSVTVNMSDFPLKYVDDKYEGDT